MSAETCWADPLTRKERRELATRLARACKKAYDARIDFSRRGASALAFDLVAVSVECSDLHLDVTERAARATS